MALAHLGFVAFTIASNAARAGQYPVALVVRAVTASISLA
jgi:hypothetical protein